MERCEVLEGFLGRADPKLVERLRQKFTQQSLDKGQFVFFEADRAEGMYLVESGVIEANVIHGDGKVYIFQFLFPGDIIGEGVLYGQEAFPFSTVVRKDAVLWKISKDDLLGHLEEDRRLEKYLLEAIGRKLDNSYTKARCIAGERVERRIACILVKIVDEQKGIIPGCGERLDTPLTNRDISGLIGSTEETVSRVMSRLKKEGVISIKDKQLVVLDRDALNGYFDTI